MNYEQLVLDNESLLSELPAELQQSAGSLLVRSLPQLHAESTRFAVRQTTRPDADTAQASVNAHTHTRTRIAINTLCTCLDNIHP